MRQSRLHLRTAAPAFSLVELLAVLSILGVLLALAAPSLLTVAPSRKAAIHQVAASLERARARAVARNVPVYVAFADGAHPGEEAPYRAWAFFVPEAPDDPDIATRALRRVSPWERLPEGLAFAHGRHFEVVEGMPFRTVLDSPARRPFPVSSADGASGSVSLPYLLYRPGGGMAAPAFVDADALHVGIVEGHFDSESGSLRPSGGEGTARGECLKIGYYTGSARILTD